MARRSRSTRGSSSRCSARAARARPRMLRIIAGFEIPDAGTVAIGGRLVAGARRLGGARTSPDRHGVPGRRALPAPHRRPERRVRRRRAGARRGVPRPRRARRPSRVVSPRALRRRAPAGRAGRARSHRSPRSCSSTSPLRRSTPACGSRCARKWSQILRDAGASVLLVTHDQQEALSLADVVDGDARRAGRADRVHRGGLRPARVALGRGVPRRRRGAARRGGRRHRSSASSGTFAADPRVAGRGRSGRAARGDRSRLRHAVPAGAAADGGVRARGRVAGSSTDTTRSCCSSSRAVGMFAAGAPGRAWRPHDVRARAWSAAR